MLRKRGGNLIRWERNPFIVIPDYAENIQCHSTIIPIPLNAGIAADGIVNCSSIDEAFDIFVMYKVLIGFVRNVSLRLSRLLRWIN